MLITSIEEQKKAARAARAVGGYDKLIAIEQQRRIIRLRGKTILQK